MTDRPIRQALLSVSDKTGIVEFAQGLVQRGVTTFHRRYRKIVGAAWFAGDGSVRLYGIPRNDGRSCENLTSKSTWRYSWPSWYR